MIGFIMAYTTSEPGPGYVATFFAACGAYPNVALLLAWAGGNAGGNLKRGVVLALVIGLGNLGGCVCDFGSQLLADGATHDSNVTAGSVLHLSTINPHVFMLATAQY
jgi:hypothetical protein